MDKRAFRFFLVRSRGEVNLRRGRGHRFQFMRKIFKQLILHPWYAALLVWLLFLTVVSLTSSYLSQAPFDARTGEHVTGLSLSYPTWGAWIEPITALAHINAGAPDVRVAVISFFGWCFLMPLLIAWIRDGLGQRSRCRDIHYGRAALLGLEISLVFAFYIVFVFLMPLPTWSLHDDNAKSDIIGDLHSHTLFSHDGLATPIQSLKQHREIGDQVVAFTEHERPPYYSVKSKNTGIIPGVEVGAADGTYVLGLGIKSEKYTPISFDRWWRVQIWINQIHEVHKGAVFAMYINLKPQDVDRLVDMGVDAFEIDNGGHAPPSDAMKAALIRAQKKYGIALLADSDWHGWSSFIQQWNLFRTAAGNSSMRPEQRIVDTLRKHGRYQIIPVTAYHFGKVSWLHALFSPLIETYRYAGELSPLRLAGWWFWGLIAIGLVRWCRLRQISPVKSAMAAGMSFMGVSGITICCARLYGWLPYREINHFAGWTYLEGLCLSILPPLAAHSIMQQMRLRKPHGETLFLSRLLVPPTSKELAVKE